MQHEALRAQSVKSIRLVYILAASHSGSTLLSLLLGSHADICTVGELKATSLGNPDRYPCSCRRAINACPFWNRIRAEMATRGFPLEFRDPQMDFKSVSSRYVRSLLKPLHRSRWAEAARDWALWLSPTWRSQSKLIKLRILNLMDCILQQARKKVLVDSSKIGIRLKYLLKMPELDVKVIRLIRDGRAVALTYMDPAGYADCGDPALRGGGGESSRQSERLSMEQAAREWKRSNEEAECLLSQLDRSRWIQARYEDLCSHPAEVLSTLARFIGVERKAINLNYRRDETHVIGNGMRLDNHTQIRLDERWRNALSASQLQSFHCIAGELNNRMGYTS